jgi:hypothetical protein
MLEIHGPRLTEVLLRAYQSPFTTRSDFARTNAEYIAVCACQGFISTNIVGDEEFGRVWHITVMGLLHLRELRGSSNEQAKLDAKDVG